MIRGWVASNSNINSFCRVTRNWFSLSINTPERSPEDIVLQLLLASIVGRSATRCSDLISYIQPSVFIEAALNIQAPQLLTYRALQSNPCVCECSSHIFTFRRTRVRLRQARQCLAFSMDWHARQRGRLDPGKSLSLLLHIDSKIINWQTFHKLLYIYQPGRMWHKVNILSGVSQVWIQSFPSTRLVT